jgi:hypothetical protein
MRTLLALAVSFALFVAAGCGGRPVPSGHDGGTGDAGRDGGGATCPDEPCDQGQACLDGVCIPDYACAPLDLCVGYDDGALYCVDLLGDPLNCGGCGIECVLYCEGGMCW